MVPLSRNPMSDAPKEPLDPALVRAESLFERGHYQEARRLADKLSKSEEPATQSAASALTERMNPAPLTKYLLFLTGLLLLAATLFAYSQH
jgi:hypothetical protein